MVTGLAGVVVGLLERRHPPGARGSLLEELVPALQRRGASVRLVQAGVGLQRLDRRPAWDVTLLKSGAPAALHLAAAASAFGIPSINHPESTRLAQDRLASIAVLARAGLPVPRSRLAWLDPALLAADPSLEAAGPMLVKASRGSQGTGLWAVESGGLASLAERLPPGPYLLMDRVARSGDDLKVFVAGAWMRAIRRVFPAHSLADKRGRPAAIPFEVAEATRRVAAVLGLHCFGCDFVRAPDGWWLVDVNAFPGYKGADGAADAIGDMVELRLAVTVP